MSPTVKIDHLNRCFPAYHTFIRYSSKMESMKEKIWSWMNSTVVAARSGSSSHSVLLETLQPPATSY